MGVGLVGSPGARYSEAMDHPLISLIDQQIAKAEAEGQFDNLPGAGKPLDTSRDPHDALMDRMMQEAEAQSPLGVLGAQITEVKARLAGMPEGTARRAVMKELADLQMKRAMEIEAMRRFG